MILHTGLNVPPKQTVLLSYLFMFRGLLFEQLVTLMARRSNRPLTVTYRQNTYKDLQKLAKLKLIVREPVQLDRIRHFHYLTEEGLEAVYQSLDIAPGYRGNGFGEDYGDFPYELQRPPKGSGIHDHILSADALLEIERLQGLYPSFNIDYRDNRYSSVSYEWEGKSYRFKPDGELRIGEKRYLLEIDKDSEFLEALKIKFEGYDRYFSWLQKQGKPLPEGVIVITDNNHKTVRFATNVAHPIKRK